LYIVVSTDGFSVWHSVAQTSSLWRHYWVAAGNTSTSGHSRWRLH